VLVIRSWCGLLSNSSAGPTPVRLCSDYIWGRKTVIDTLRAVNLKHGTRVEDSFDVSLTVKVKVGTSYRKPHVCYLII
jgi:hypothetical protein